jgi:integrase/recombinase XerD
MTDSGDVGLHGAGDDDSRSAADLSNEELTEVFFEYSKKRTKESTTEFYRTNFTPFYEYVAERNGHLTEHVGPEDIEEFLMAEAERLQPKTVGHRYAAISRFYNVLRDKKELLPAGEKLPIEQVERGDIKGMSKKTMTETSDGKAFHYLDAEQVTRLIENAPAPELRNRALLILMANTGLRVSEICRVRIDGDYLDLNRKKLTVKSPKKSDDDENDPEWITVYWRSQTVSEVLDSYIRFERPTYPFAEESSYLFPSQQSERIHYDQINRIVKGAAENAGLQGVDGVDATGNDRHQVTPHVLRHSYAMTALENGMSIDEIRDNLHHTDISVTMKYLRRHEEDRRKAVEKYGPQFG